MTKQEEIVKVFTKYDTPFLKINIPIIPELRARNLNDDSLLNEDILFEYEEWGIKYIEEGLEGVKFFHYAK